MTDACLLSPSATGWPHAAIGREEAISRERVREIVARAPDEEGTGRQLVHAPAKPPLTQQTALISLANPARRQAPGLTSLDKT